MTPEEITALAREYAGKTVSMRHTTAIVADEAEDVIRILLRRYCLVEKSKIEEEYYEAKFACGNIDPCSETWATYQAKKSTLERLFPEIAKEVEG